MRLILSILQISSSTLKSLRNKIKHCQILFYLCKYYLFSNKVCKMIYFISTIIDRERFANIKQSVETPDRRSFWIRDSCDR